MKHLLLTTIAAVVLVGCGPKPPNATPTERKAARALQRERTHNTRQDEALLSATHQGNIEDVKKHLAAGADVNTKGELHQWRWIPLCNAAERGHKEIVELLISKGADLEAKYLGKTPLHWAAFKGHKEIVELLIANGADVNTQDKTSQNRPMDTATLLGHPEIVDLLRKHGGKTEYFGKTGEELKVGESRKAPAQPPSPPVEPVAKAAPPEPPTAKAPATSIHDAAMDGDIEAVKQHLADGADVNAKIEGGVFSGRTPLDLAWLTRQTKTADLLRKHGGKTGEELKAEGK